MALPQMDGGDGALRPSQAEECVGAFVWLNPRVPRIQDERYCLTDVELRFRISRGQRSEVRGQRSEVRGQRSEVRGQRSEVSYAPLPAAAPPPSWMLTSLPLAAPVIWAAAARLDTISR